MHLVRTLIVILISSGLARAQQQRLSVEHSGHGPAIIFIPGLYCSGDVWKETTGHLKDRYTCYSITLPGFAGQAPLPPSDSLLDQFATEIAGYIQTNGIRHPVLVGHSLGGWLALRIGSRYPGLCGGIVSVSSAPFLPALSMGNGITLDSARAIGAQIKHYMGIQTPEQAKIGSHAAISFMIRDSARIATVDAMAARSDVSTQAEVMYELFSTDLRSDMRKVTCPILVLGDWISYKGYGATRENTLDKYRSQFALASDVRIELNDSSKHFIMYDEPEWFDAKLDEFLVSVK
jgi:pimeloyl-ACP methyl ester carboxylesterase